jgi:hypothetical protein
MNQKDTKSLVFLFFAKIEPGNLFNQEIVVEYGAICNV